MHVTNPLRSFGLALMLMLGAGLPGLRPSMAQSPALQLYALTEIKGGQNGHYVIDASINSQRITVLVDTGASVVRSEERRVGKEC